MTRTSTRYVPSKLRKTRALLKNRKMGRVPYLVQKGIPMLQYNGRPFDLRLMVMKNEFRNWEIPGIFGRVALPGMIVTNRSQGGRIMPVERLLRPHIKTVQITCEPCIL